MYGNRGERIFDVYPSFSMSVNVTVYHSCKLEGMYHLLTWVELASRNLV